MWLIAVIVKPFMLLFLMVGIVLPVELALKKVFPDCKAKRFLFDKTLADREPMQYMAVWFLAVGVMVLLVLFISGQ